MALNEQVTMMPEPFVTADDIAVYLKVTRRQVLEMTRKEMIPAHPLGTGAHRRIWRYKISEVDDAIATGTRKSAASQKQHGFAQEGTPRTIPVGSPRSQRGKL
jgi:excisionase family DNA binding protein